MICYNKIVKYATKKDNEEREHGKKYFGFT